MTKFLSVLFLLVIVAILLVPQTNKVKSRKPISEKNTEWLKQLMGKSLKNNDLPIGALLLFDDEVIGEGNHNHQKENNAHGHAAINAISDAIKNMTYDKFMALDRNKMKILVSSDPCMMCKGAIINYKINKVEILMTNNFKKSFKNFKNSLLFDFNKIPVGNETMQDSMMVLHPKYPFAD